METYTVLADGTYTDSVTGGQFKYHVGDVLSMETAVRLGMPGAALPAEPSDLTDDAIAQIQALIDVSAAAALAAYEPKASVQARAATADGTGTGVVSAGSDFVQVTSANAAHIVTLPAPTPGVALALYVGATGYELRSSAPATVGINGGVGVAAESAIPPNTLTVCFCPIATNWMCTDQSANGTVVTTEIAAP